MVAQTVPTSARYIDKLTTVGTCSASRENEDIRLFSMSTLRNTDILMQLKERTKQERGRGHGSYCLIFDDKSCSSFKR